ncbi:NUDIX hydrolase [Dietzia sp.]|uniref:NUDIX hydrolase n=1 Tax=Dietzia sp. TaxID=1871616 RepID=UPI002FDA9B0A
MVEGTTGYEVLESTRPFSGLVASVRVDTVTMPGGHSALREVVEHMGGVGVVAVDEEDRVCLIRQYRHPLGERIWEVPAGLRDVEGEAPESTAARELAEEAALAADSLAPLVTLATSPGFSTEVVHVFLATGLSPQPPEEREDEEAEIEVSWVPLEDAVKRVLSGEIINAIAVAGLLAASRMIHGRRER